MSRQALQRDLIPGRETILGTSVNNINILMAFGQDKSNSAFWDVRGCRSGHWREEQCLFRRWVP
ncbi:hypothetical protein BDV59DRAFT_188224 [Aspergillus ambiguus]|uniref:uncharacterized protein n=1 Tax=Aspergillus ambiguus TaxID=176160 RepID=UPI003CCCE5D2